MGAETTYEAGKNRFLWGLLLAWAPAIPFIVGMSNTFHGVSERKATGIGTVVGGFLEAYVLFGFLAMLAFQVGGIVLLMRSPSGGKPLHALLSFASIAWSVLMLIFLGLFLWLKFAFPHS